MSNIILVDDWILAGDLWNQKQSLNQLNHNHCPPLPHEWLLASEMYFLIRWSQMWAHDRSFVKG